VLHSCVQQAATPGRLPKNSSSGRYLFSIRLNIAIKPKKRALANVLSTCDAFPGTWAWSLAPSTTLSPTPCSFQDFFPKIPKHVYQRRSRFPQSCVLIIRIIYSSCANPGGLTHLQRVYRRNTLQWYCNTFCTAIFGWGGWESFLSIAQVGHCSN